METKYSWHASTPSKFSRKKAVRAESGRVNDNNEAFERIDRIERTVGRGETDFIDPANRSSDFIRS